MTPLADGQRVCVIGAGSSGIAACQVLHARGIPFDCFEIGSEVGGNWRYMNDNGMSSAYRSLHINTSRRLMAYATFPMPADYPDYPDHFQIARYFDAYVDHFGFRDRIRFRTEVTRVAPAGGAAMRSRLARSRAARRRPSATTRCSSPTATTGTRAGPSRRIRAQTSSRASSSTSTTTRSRTSCAGKHVLVLGIGNSATDIAVESSRIADRTLLAMRRGAYVIPKYMLGKPPDETNSTFLSRAPLLAPARGARRRAADRGRAR